MRRIMSRTTLDPMSELISFRVKKTVQEKIKTMARESNLKTTTYCKYLIELLADANKLPVVETKLVAKEVETA